MDLSLQRLVVRGPAAEVAAFRKCAKGGRVPGEWDWQSIKPNSKRIQLDFKRLKTVFLPDANAHLEPPSDPIDLVVETPKPLKRGTGEVVYRFLLGGRGGEPEPFFTEASMAFPKLCFVFGTVEGFEWEQNGSLFLYKGKQQRWRLPEKRKKALTATVEKLSEIEGGDDATRQKLLDELSWASPDETLSDKIFRASVEADWAMMDEVMDHWNAKAQKTLAIIARGLHEKSKPRRKATGTTAAKRKKK